MNNTKKEQNEYFCIWLGLMSKAWNINNALVTSKSLPPLLVKSFTQYFFLIVINPQGLTLSN